MSLHRPATLLLALVATATATASAWAASLSFKDRYATVNFSWSREAAAIPQLDRQFRREFIKAKARFIRGGREEYRDREKNGTPGVGWERSTKITTLGQTRRLLSLARADWDYTGGAHGNGATKLLLWDRAAGREIAFTTLFAKAGSFEALTRTSYCQRLGRERAKRRGGDEKMGNGISEFDSCPKFADLALLPVDDDRNGRFDTVELNAAPYVAGPFAEGEYAIRLPVTRALIAAMKPQFRSAFEAQRQ